ncbi:MAG: Arm DNA-binding domain-containing protein [Xanthomonadales bacterium]|nr:Arm DNA-binding domain-containing protein [Xanthomonadales bacterium]
MTLTRDKLTDRHIKSIKPENRARIYYDNQRDAPKGFGLRVTHAGTKSWILRYFVKGRERRLTLKYGYPAWEPKRARMEASNIKTDITAGHDPLTERAEKAKAERIASSIYAMH